jgi:endonuclease G
MAVTVAWGADGRRRHDETMTTADAASPPAGYDTGFLEVAVPLPISAVPRDTADLDYLRFSVTLDRTRSLAVVTGVNIDGRLLQDLPRTGEWHFDSRIPASEQTGPAVYASNDLDRGHLVRRRDPGWGPEAIARAATEATFTYPNAAPQAADFNQSKELWLGLENHVLEYSEANDLRVSVFTAPVLGADDPPYRGVRVPLRFWKIAAWVASDGRLAAAGFILDQTALIDTATERARILAPLDGFRTFQVPIRHIGALADVDFGPLVRADVLGDDLTLSARRWVELGEPADIRLSPVQE